MLDYPGFVEFATVVHEHVLCLRSWHLRSTSQQSLLNTRAKIESRADNERSDGSLLLAVRGDDGNQSKRTIDMDGQRPARQGATLPGGQTRVAEESAVAPVTKPPFADTTSFGVKTKLQLPLKGGCPPPRKLDTATPWLSWDFFASNDTTTTGAKNCSSAAAVVADSVPPTTGGDIVQNGEDTKAEPQDGGNSDHSGCRDVHNGEEKAAEEPNMNRAYGGADNDVGASVNKLFAFQTDRIVRILDEMF